MAEQLPEGTVTVLFTDVVGSTELTNRIGDEPARAVLGAREELVREQIERHRGQEVKGVGDGLMVAFTSARRAVACAIDIQRASAELNRRSPEEAVQIKIGMNTGEVIREEADLFGATVNAAQRIADCAAPDEILISEGVKVVLGSGSSVELNDGGARELKGFPEPWRLYGVVWDDHAADSAAGRTPYIGRDEERQELRRRVQEALEGRGALVMIGGEPGVGKTRLAEEVMAEAAEREMLPLIGHCYETEGAVPYIPYVEMLEMAVRTVSLDGLRTALGDSAPAVAKLMPELRRIFPDIGEPPELPPDQERRYLFNGMREYLARASDAQSLLFVLDDLHWADDSTIQLLEHLAQDLHQRRILFIGTYRDVELDVGRPLARMLERLLRQRMAHRISLRRLPQDSVAAMLRALSGQEAPSALVEAVYSETEGNPFFVEEVFHHLAEEGRLFDERGRWRQDLTVDELDVPEGVRLVVGRRLERVGDVCRRALGAAAVIGRRFQYEVLEATGEVEPDLLLDAIDDAQGAHLIVEEEGRKEAWFSFAHELIRQTLLASLSLPRRQRMHLRVADALERLHGSSADEHAGDLAHHLYQAGAAADPERTCRYLTVAGDQALAAAAFEEAARLFDHALAVLAPDAGARRAELLYKRGLALRSFGRWEDALNDWREALPLFEQTGGGVAMSQLCLAMAEQLGWHALWAESAEVGLRGVSAMGNEQSPYRGALLAITGLATALGGSYEEGMSLLQEAEVVARELDDEMLLGRVLGGRGSVNQWYYRPLDALRDAEPAGPLLRKAEDFWQLVDTLFVTCYSLSTSGRLDEAEHVAQEAIEVAERVGHLGGVMAARRGITTARLARTGDVDAWEQFSLEDLRVAEQVEMPWVSNAHTNLALVHFCRGHWDDALAEAADAVALEPPGMLDGWDSGHAMLIRAYAGDQDGALALLDRKRDLLPKPGQANMLGSWAMLLCAVQALALLDRQDEAGPWYDLTLEALEGGARILWPATPAHLPAALAASALARWDEAEQHFETALRYARDLPILIAQPDVRRWHGWTLLTRGDAGDAERARALLQEAAQQYAKLGMPKHEALARELLASV